MGLSSLLGSCHGPVELQSELLREQLGGYMRNADSLTTVVFRCGQCFTF